MLKWAVQPLKGFRVIPVNCLSDNYAYIIQSKNGMCAVVDPVEPDNVEKIATKNGIQLTDFKMIITTHKHWDHAGGNPKMIAKVPEIQVVAGPDDVKTATKVMLDNDTLTFDNLTITAMVTPCHTSGSTCFFVEAKDEEDSNTALFSGDTMFIGGCGRFFEGSAEEMFKNMSRFKQLPLNTHVYSGHEYTKSNLVFCAHVEPENEDIKSKLTWAQEQTNTHPSTIEQELATNVFLRANSVEQMRERRTNKDTFKA